MLPLASKGGWFSSKGLLHLCVFSLRIPPHPASGGSPSYPPSPEAAEGAAHLLRDSRQHLLHRQDQLSGSDPRPVPPPALSSVPVLCHFSQRQTKDRFVHFPVREAFISDRKVPKWMEACLCVPSRLLNTTQSCYVKKKQSTAINTPRNIVICSTRKPHPILLALFLSKDVTSVFLGVFWGYSGTNEHKEAGPGWEAACSFRLFCQLPGSLIPPIWHSCTMPDETGCTSDTCCPQ